MNETQDINSLSPETLDSVLGAIEMQRMNRRQALLRAVGGGAAIAAGAILPSLLTPKRANAQNPANPSDIDILNFALNFEYLEAEFYSLGATGQTIEDLGVQTGRSGAEGLTFRASPRVTFANSVSQRFSEEIAANERAHVNFLRTALGSAAIPRPNINFTDAFNAVANAAQIPGGTFDPFASEINFIIGAAVFADVTVTALKGAAPLIDSKAILTDAAALLGTEGYHVGGLRLRIFQGGPTAQENFRRISDLRDTLDGNGDKDQPVVLNGQANLVPTDENALAFSRSFSEVLRIVYANPAPGVSQGGFFPNGVNGNIRTT
jgi:hypothetical protein